MITLTGHPRTLSSRRSSATTLRLVRRGAVDRLVVHAWPPRELVDIRRAFLAGLPGGFTGVIYGAITKVMNSVGSGENSNIHALLQGNDGAVY